MLFAGIASAQNIVFNGTIFKSKLLSATTSNGVAIDSNGNSIQIDGDGDSEISYTEATAVYKLYIDNAFMDNLDGIEHFTSLTDLDFHQNLVTSINFSSLVNLQNVIANHNSLTTLDISTLTNLLYIDVSNNLLETIYAKNGTTSDVIDFTGGSNTNVLSYICTDELQVTTLQSQLPGSSTCVVNSYCTVPPGGIYSTLSGTIVFDELSNGIDASDPKFPFIKVACVIGSQVLQTTSDANGQYVFYTQQTTGSFSIVPVIENTNAFVIPPSFMGTLGSNVIHDFAITPATTPVPDLEVVVNPFSPAVSGSDAVYQVTYKNKGSKAVTGNVQLNYDSTNLTIVSCTDTNASIATLGQVSLNFTNLLPFETRSFYVTLTVNSAYTAGNFLDFNTIITDDLGPTEPTTSIDNSFTYRQTVGTPISNQLKCLEGAIVDSSQIGQYLHYDLHFVNNGNAVATSVVVKTIFDATKYDLNSIQLLNSSHPLDVKMDGDVALFHLNNVAIGGPGGDGGILLKIKSNANLVAGQTVTSNAELFFDYGTNFNIAITPSSSAITNIEATTYQNLSVSQYDLDSSIVVYPNPASSAVTISSKSTITSTQLFDVFGRLLQTNLTNSDKVTMDITERLNGVYFLKITSESGQKVERIVKE